MSPLTPIRSEEVLRRAYAIGNYYGFMSFPALSATTKGNRPTKQPYPSGLKVHELDPMAQSVAAFLKQVRDIGVTPSIPQPLFVWHTNITPGRPAPKQVLVQFHAIGAPHAIADTVMMRAVHAFVADLFKTEPTLHINSIGDRETRARFVRELGHYFRRHGDVLPPDCVACAKHDPFEAIEALIARACTSDFPSSVDHLSEASRKHFENVLEFLEETGTPYELSSGLISRANAWTETCFELRTGDERAAWGSRYNELTEPFFHTALPSVAAIVRLTTHRGTVSSVRTPKKPRIMFLHIGDEAKRTGIRLTEDLRNARLPLSQIIGIESLTEQMRIAESINPAYLLIMGRKEALEGNAILRDRDAHTETVIPIETLVESIKSVA